MIRLKIETVSAFQIENKQISAHQEGSMQTNHIRYSVFIALKLKNWSTELKVERSSMQHCTMHNCTWQTAKMFNIWFSHPKKNLNFFASKFHYSTSLWIWIFQSEQEKPAGNNNFAPHEFEKFDARVQCRAQDIWMKSSSTPVAYESNPSNYIKTKITSYRFMQLQVRVWRTGRDDGSLSFNIFLDLSVFFRLAVRIRAQQINVVRPCTFGLHSKSNTISQIRRWRNTESKEKKRKMEGK